MDAQQTFLHFLRSYKMTLILEKAATQKVKNVGHVHVICMKTSIKVDKIKTENTNHFLVNKLFLI